MITKALLQLGAELLFEFRRANGPADRELAAYLRERKFLGAKDKAFLSDCFFHVLRHLRRFDEAILSAFAGTIATETRFTAGFPVTNEVGARPWLRAEGVAKDMARQTSADRAVDTIRMGLAAVELHYEQATVVAEELVRFWPMPPTHVIVQSASMTRMMERAVEVAALYNEPKKILDEDRAYSFPTWLWARLAHGRAPQELRALGVALNQQGPVAMRINTLKTSVDAAEAALTESKTSFERSALVPGAIVLKQRIARMSLPNMTDGWFETQDEGSQLVGVHAGVQPGMTVIDACAGAGGKTLQLAALMENKGRIHAFDIEPNRLENLQRRGGRAGVTNIDATIPLNRDGEPATSVPQADVVLVDAPCSGLGTLRRAPDIKWRLSPARLEYYKQAQRELLERWSQYVKPGGMLVYATCSLLAEENELQAEAFLAANRNFSHAPLPPSPSVALTANGELKVTPSANGCDGFYAVRFLRN
ncbi:RsmB/NOP family class I SAM-dependent RNA methyltransferase [Candidatus Sumerlaeota bacterium]|nr:RsmB/NOP family class I SAM-dependent RNA methyltransferase [Candidatus Sumerlaeota bacterium]